MYPYAQSGSVGICARAIVTAHTASTRRAAKRVFIGPQSNVRWIQAGIRDPGFESRVPNPESRDMDDQGIYAAIGEDGFRRLIAAFYRQVPGDEILGKMYPPQDLAGAE